jgi:hypothetical protein
MFDDHIDAPEIHANQARCGPRKRRRCYSYIRDEHQIGYNYSARAIKKPPAGRAWRFLDGV